MGWPREAVDTAVLAAAIRVDRAIETDVRRVVAGDDLARGIGRDRGLERRQVLETLPAIVEDDASLRFVAAARIGLCTPAAAPAPFDGDREFGEVVFRAR